MEKMDTHVGVYRVNWKFWNQCWLHEDFVMIYSWEESQKSFVLQLHCKFALFLVTFGIKGMFKKLIIAHAFLIRWNSSFYPVHIAFYCKIFTFGSHLPVIDIITCTFRPLKTCFTDTSFNCILINTIFSCG